MVRIALDKLRKQKLFRHDKYDQIETELMKKYKNINMEKHKEDYGLGTLKRIHVFTNDELEDLAELRKHEKVLGEKKRWWAGENGKFDKKELKNYYHVWDAHNAVKNEL